MDYIQRYRFRVFLLRVLDAGLLVGGALLASYGILHLGR